MRWMVVATVSIVCCLPFAVHAGSSPGVVLVSGKAEQRDKTIAVNAAEARLREVGWSLSKPFATKDVDAVMRCFSFVPEEAWSCVTKVIRDRGVGRLVVVTLSPEPTVDGARQVVITERLVPENGQAILFGQRFCVQCTDDTLATLTRELTSDLLDRAAVRSGRTVLSIKSVPQRAKYYLDGSLLGVTDAMIDVVPGKHTVTFEHEGFVQASRTIEAVEGTTTEVSASLERLDASSRPSGPHRANSSTHTTHQGTGPERSTTQQPQPSLLLPGLVVGVGAAAVATGVILYAIDQDPRMPGGGRRYRDTGPAGVAFGATGLVVAGVGAYLWYRASRTPAGTSIAVSSDGAVLTWQGSF